MGRSRPHPGFTYDRFEFWPGPLNDDGTLPDPTCTGADGIQFDKIWRVSRADILNYDPVAWFSGSGSNFQDYFAEYVQGVLLSGDDPAAGFEAFMGRVDALIRQPNPVAG